MKYHLMVRPTWQGAFRRGALVFELGESVEVTQQQLESMLSDVGKALCVAKHDDKGRPKPDWDKTNRLTEGEDIANVFADLPPVVESLSFDEEPISLEDSLIPKKHHTALKKANLHNLEGIAAYLENHDDLTGIHGIAEAANKEILEALEAHSEPDPA